MSDSRQVVDLTNTKQFLWAVFTIIKFPIEINVRFLFVQYTYHWTKKHLTSSVHENATAKQYYGNSIANALGLQQFCVKKSDWPMCNGIWCFQILSRCDILFFQEIRDASNTAFPSLMEKLNA